MNTHVRNFIPSILYKFLDPRFKKFPRLYLQQAIFGGVFIGGCIFILTFFVNAESVRSYIIGSIAASTFLVFGAPHLGSSKPEKIFFGHLIAIVVGLCCLLIAWQFEFKSNTSPSISIIGGISVVIAIFLMTVLDFEHPPAAGTALALSTHNAQTGIDPYFQAVIVIVCFMIFVSVLLSLIRKHLYYEYDHLKSIEGFGAKEIKSLNEEAIFTVSELAILIEKDQEKVCGILQNLIEKNTFFKHSQSTETAQNIVNEWIEEARSIKKAKKRYMILEDLF